MGCGQRNPPCPSSSCSASVGGAGAGEDEGRGRARERRLDRPPSTPTGFFLYWRGTVFMLSSRAFVICCRRAAVSLSFRGKPPNPRRVRTRTMNGARRIPTRWRLGVRQSSAAFGSIAPSESARGLAQSITWRHYTGFMGSRPHCPIRAKRQVSALFLRQEGSWPFPPVLAEKLKPACSPIL